MRKHKEKGIKKQYMAWCVVIIGIMQSLHWLFLWTNIKSREYLGVLIIVLVTTIFEIADNFEVRRYNPLVGKILLLLCSYLSILMDISIQTMVVTIIVEIMIILGGMWILYLRNNKR